jgi:hypothetical protein
VKKLKALVLRRKTAQDLALRACIVPACADGQDDKVVAASQRVTPQMVSKWRARLSSIDSMACWTRRAAVRQEPSTMPEWMR